MILSRFTTGCQRALCILYPLKSIRLMSGRHLELHSGCVAVVMSSRSSICAQKPAVNQGFIENVFSEAPGDEAHSRTLTGSETVPPWYGATGQSTRRHP